MTIDFFIRENVPDYFKRERRFLIEQIEQLYNISKSNETVFAIGKEIRKLASYADAFRDSVFDEALENHERKVSKDKRKSILELTDKICAIHLAIHAGATVTARTIDGEKVVLNNVWLEFRSGEWKIKGRCIDMEESKGFIDPESVVASLTGKGE